MKRDRRVLGLLIAIQAALFVTFYYREIAWYPPPVCDQAVYLERSYAIQESVARNGLPELLRPFVTGGHNTNVAFPVEGALFGFFIAAPRNKGAVAGRDAVEEVITAETPRLDSATVVSVLVQSLVATLKSSVMPRDYR